MRIVFLDIDGVLNSKRYDLEKTPEQGNIDETRLALLKRLADQTGASLVLISSWRKHWDQNEALCDDVGRELNDTFRRHGLSIMDKTPDVDPRDRPAEVRRWLDEHRGEVAQYVILDDIPWGWGELEDRHVRTDYLVGRGLGERHVREACEILMK